MTCHGICLGQGLLRCQRKKRREERQAERRRMGWWMRHIMQYVFKKGFFLPSFPRSRLWSGYPLQCTVDQLHWKRIPQHTLCYLLRLLLPHGTERKGNGNGKEGCILKSVGAVTQERGRRRAILLWHFSSLLSLLTEWWGSQACFCYSGDSHVCFCAWMCTVGVLGVTDLPGAGAAVTESHVPKDSLSVHI